MEGWIWRDNVAPVLWVLAHLAGGRFDDGEMAAIELGIAKSDSEADRWFEWRLEGSTPTTIRFARDPNGDEVSISVESGIPDVAVRAVLVAAQDFYLRSRR